MVRQEFYNINLNNPASASNQPVGAHGYSVSASTGYNFDLGQGWFIEPSAGFIYSKTNVDRVRRSRTATIANIGIDLDQRMHRARSAALSLRVGKTIETPNVIWQPFASASVFHEFAGNTVVDPAQRCTTVRPPVPALPTLHLNQTTTIPVGTYGQYSLGVAGQVVNTGWLGFVRVDYRNGDHIDGWTGNAGIRYQFTPEMIAAVMPTKAPVKAAPAARSCADQLDRLLCRRLLRRRRGPHRSRSPAFRPDGHQTAVGARRIGGAELGYNYQFANNWVVGVEGDIGATNLHGSRLDYGGQSRPAAELPKLVRLDRDRGGACRLSGPDAVLCQGRRRLGR